MLGPRDQTLRRRSLGRGLPTGTRSAGTGSLTTGRSLTCARTTRSPLTGPPLASGSGDTRAFPARSVSPRPAPGLVASCTRRLPVALPRSALAIPGGSFTVPSITATGGAVPAGRSLPSGPVSVGAPGTPPALWHQRRRHSRPGVTTGADDLQAVRDGCLRLWRGYRQDRDPVDLNVGLRPHDVSDLGSGIEDVPVQNAFRLARARRPPGPASIWTRAGELELHPGRHCKSHATGPCTSAPVDERGPGTTPGLLESLPVLIGPLAYRRP